MLKSLDYLPGGGTSNPQAFLYSEEYESTILPSLQNHNPPCAICYISSCNTLLMIPAKTLSHYVMGTRDKRTTKEQQKNNNKRSNFCSVY